MSNQSCQKFKPYATVEAFYVDRRHLFLKGPNAPARLLPENVHFFQHDIQHLITQSQPPRHMDIHRRVGVTLCQRRCPQAVTLRLEVKRGNTPISPSCQREYPSRQYPDSVLWLSMSGANNSSTGFMDRVLSEFCSNGSDDATIFKPVFKAASRSAEASRQWILNRWRRQSSCRPKT